MVATAPVRRVAPPHVAPPPHSWSTPFAAPSEELVKFAAWPSCNDPQYAAAVGVAARQRLCLTDGGRLKPLPWRSSDPEADLFDGDTLQNKLGRALAAVEAIDRKEFFEAFEGDFDSTSSSDENPQELDSSSTGGAGLTGSASSEDISQELDSSSAGGDVGLAGSSSEDISQSDDSSS